MGRVGMLVILVGMGVAVAATTAAAQAPIVLASLDVQLWPEYDQPSMLVIYDFQLAPGTELPAYVPVRYPKDGNLVAVAMHGEGGSLLIADYTETEGDLDWQTVSVQVDTPTAYRIEYYQPLDRTGQTRNFEFAWPGDFRVETVALSVRIPRDATEVVTTPLLSLASSDDLATYHAGTFGPLDAGEALSLQLSYGRSSEALSGPPQGLAPSAPLDGSTSGRVVISNYLPYFLGALAVVLIGGGAFYLWQTGRGTSGRAARRHTSAGAADRQTEDTYCHECGTRAQPGDRFCRVCGTRLRPPE